MTTTADRSPARLVVLGAEPGQVIGDVAGLLDRASTAGVPVALVWVTDGPGAFPASTFATGTDTALRRRTAITRALEELDVVPAERVWLQLDRDRVVADPSVLARALMLVVQPGDVVVVPDPTSDAVAESCLRAACGAVPFERVVTRFAAPRPRSIGASFTLDADIAHRRALALQHLETNLLHDRSTDVEFYDVDPLELAGVPVTAGS